MNQTTSLLSTVGRRTALVASSPATGLVCKGARAAPTRPTGNLAHTAKLMKFFEVYMQKIPEDSAAERFQLEGAGHVAPDTVVPQAMKNSLDAKGRADLDAPASGGRSAPQALETMPWLPQSPIPQASTP